MNDPVVIQMPAGIAVKTVARVIAAAVLGIAFAFFAQTGDRADFANFEQLSPEEQQQELERYERKLEHSANRNTSENVVYGISGGFFFVGVYEVAAFAIAMFLGKFVNFGRQIDGENTSAWPDQHSGDG